jgi:hypothetical protein
MNRTALTVFAAAGLASLVNGCVYPDSLTAHPSVVLDASFRPDEVAGILDGMRAWEEHVPGVHFDVRMEGDLRTLRNDAYQQVTPNTVYVVRVNGSAPDAYCPMRSGTSVDPNTGKTVDVPAGTMPVYASGLTQTSPGNTSTMLSVA